MISKPTRDLRNFSLPVLRRLLGIFLLVAALLGGVVLVLHYEDLANERTLHEELAGQLVDLHTDIIRREFKSVASDLLYLSNQAVLRDFFTSRGGTRQQVESEYILFCRHKEVYDQIRYLDTAGQEVIRVNYNDGKPAAVLPAELQSKVSRYYVQESLPLGRGKIFLSPFDLNVEHDQIEQPPKPVIRLATPVFDHAGAKRGVLIVNYLGEVLLRKLNTISVSFPGTVMLLNRAGYFLRGPSTDDEWGFMFGKDRTLASYYPAEWQHIDSQPRGRAFTEHGLFSFRTLRPGDELPGGRPGSRAIAAPAPSETPSNDVSLIVVAHVPTNVINARTGQLLLGILFVYCVALIPILVLGWYLAYASALRRTHEQHIAESESRLRKLSTQLITAQEDERRRLSRDLHDELGQIATAVTIGLERAASQEDAGKRTELIDQALRGSQYLLEQLHEIVARIRPALLDDLGLKDAVRNLLSDYERATGIAVNADLQVEATNLPATVSENAYRILQEALNNVAKYAKTQEVSVRLTAGADKVELYVRDAGVGFDAEKLDGKGLGILGMRERAELLNGSFALRAAPGKGTEIQVVLPVGES